MSLHGPVFEKDETRLLMSMLPTVTAGPLSPPADAGETLQLSMAELPAATETCTPASVAALTAREIEAESGRFYVSDMIYSMYS